MRRQIEKREDRREKYEKGRGEREEGTRGGNEWKRQEGKERIE